MTSNLALALCKPSWEHWFGCDPYGVPITERMLQGALFSFGVAAFVVALTLTAGLLLGTWSAMASKRAQTAITWMEDVFLAFPGLLLAILLATLLPPSGWTVVLALSFSGWAGVSRLCRAIAQQAIAEPYFEAAIAGGAGRARLVTRHLWPALSEQLRIQALLAAAHAVVGEASLSFLGLGGPIEGSSWGRMIAEGKDYLVEAPHLSLIPGTFLVLTVFALYRLALSPRKVKI